MRRPLPGAPGPDAVADGPLRILHVAAPAHAGGLESVIQSLVPAQVERGHAVAVAAVVVPGDGAAAALFRPLRDLPVRLEALELPSRAYVAEARALARVIRAHDASIVHTHGYRSDVVGGMVARVLRRPRVTTVHGFIGGTSRGRLYERLQRRALRRFDAVVAVSAPLAERLREAGVPPGRLHLVRNAWRAASPPLSRDDARAALGLEDGSRHVGWVGRLSLEKAPDLAVRALAALPAGDVALSLVGDGPMRADLEALATSLGVRDRVRFHGLLDGAGRFMRAFDVLLLSSRTEGTPIVVLEAMAAGLPIVATRVGGVPDVVEGVAELVEPERPDAMAAALGRVLDCPEQAAARAREAERRVAASFAPGPWAEAYDRVYRGVLG